MEEGQGCMFDHPVEQSFGYKKQKNSSRRKEGVIRCRLSPRTHEAVQLILHGAEKLCNSDLSPPRKSFVSNMWP